MSAEPGDRDRPVPASAPSAGALARGFPAVGVADWTASARRGDATARPTTVVDGLDVAWLYTRADELAADPGGVPGRAPFVRGVRAGRPWAIRQEHAEPRRAAARAAILADLEGGATAVTLRLDDAAREGAAPGGDAFAAGRGRDGLMVSTLDDLDETLDGVLLELAPAALDAGAAAPAAAAVLAALWARRGLLDGAGPVGGAFRYDPVGTLAEDGLSAGAPQDAVTAAGRFAADVARRLPGVTSLAVDTRAYVGAGATAVTELAVAAATGVAYLRAGEAAGLAPGETAATVEFTYQVGPDQFLEIAKLRAARRVWARVLETSGVAPARRWSPTFARTARRMLAAVDPWTNLLRATTAAFAAGAGGADGLAVTPFDAVDGRPDELGRRIARNTQLILQEESQLGRVADPAGGSWYVESLTDALARAAWRRLQAIERDGGILAVLLDGSLAADLAAAASDRRDAVARRIRTLTGVNAFPLLGDDGLARPEPPDRAALAMDEARRLAAATGTSAADVDAAPGRGFDALVARAAAGAPLHELVGPLRQHLPLPQQRDAEPFERLRRAAAADGPPPRVFLACVGPLARFTQAATWAGAYFRSGGLEPVGDGVQDSTAALVAAYAAADTPLAAVCAAADEDVAAVAATVAALRDAGAERIYLADATEGRAAAAGADTAAHDGQDMIELLGDALRRAGVEAPA